MCCFRGAERFDEFQEGSLGEDDAPETSVAGDTTPGGAQAVEVIAACTVDSFCWPDGFAV